MADASFRFHKVPFRVEILIFVSALAAFGERAVRSQFTLLEEGQVEL